MSEDTDALLRELRELNEGDHSDQRQDRQYGPRYRKALDQIWQSFKTYLIDPVRPRTHLLPEGTTAPEDLLVPDLPHPTLASLAGYMTHWATGANSIVSDKPSVTTAKSRFTGFCSYYSEKKGSSLPEATKDAMNRFVRITMVDRLLVSAVKRVRSLINITGYKEVRDMLFSLRYEATTRQRFQMLFWLALTAQTALRVGAHFNNAMDPPGSPTMTFGCFVLILLAPDPSYPSTNRINLEYRHVYHKTETTYMATHTLIQSNEPWRCPVFLFLLLAYLDKIIDVPLSQLLDPAFLEGRERREVRFTGDIGSRLVCHGVTSRGRHEGWTTDHVANQLRRLSRLCGFAHNLTAHTFRRTVAIWMRIGGAKLKDLAMKLGHLNPRTTHNSYLLQAPAVDVGAAVFGNESQLAQALPLHPDMLVSTGVDDRELSPDQRAEILSDPSVQLAAQHLEELRSKTLAVHPKLRDAPPDTRKELDRLYGQWYHQYRQATRSYVSKLGISDMDGVPRSLPTAGAGVDYDVLGLEISLTMEAANTGSGGETDPSSTDQDTDPKDWAIDPELLEDPTAPGPSNAQPRLSGADTSTPIPSIDPYLLDQDSEDQEIWQQNQNLLTACLEAISRPVSTPQILVQTMNVCLAMPENVKSMMDYRPGEAPLDGFCPGCNRLLIDILPPSTGSTPASRRKSHKGSCLAHVNGCSAKRVTDEAGRKLLDVFPARLATCPWEQPVSEKIKSENKASVNPLPYEVHQLAANLDAGFNKKRGQNYTKTCSTCAEVFPSASLFKSHLVTDHDIFLPLVLITPSLKNKIENSVWDLEVLSLPLARFSHHDQRYHPDPRELDFFSESIYEDRFSHTPQHGYGKRDDISYRAEEEAMVTGVGAGTSDERYKVVKVDGVTTGDGHCILCVNDPLLSWSDRMIPFDNATDAAGHGSNCLRKRFTACIEHWRSQLLKRDQAVPTFGPIAPPFIGSGPRVQAATDSEDSVTSDGDMRRKTAKGKRRVRPNKGERKPVDLRTPLMIDDDDGHLICPDPGCMTQGHRFETLVTLAAHLVSVHSHPIATPQALLSTVLTLRDYCMMNEQELEDHITRGEGIWFRQEVTINRNKTVKRKIQPAGVQERRPNKPFAP